MSAPAVGTIVIGGLTFPAECPPNCKFMHDGGGQGGWCHRCPVFNCGGDEPLVLPEEYRQDWAEEWAKVFSGEKDYPELLLLPRSFKEGGC